MFLKVWAERGIESEQLQSNCVILLQKSSVRLTINCVCARLRPNLISYTLALEFFVIFILLKDFPRKIYYGRWYGLCCISSIFAHEIKIALFWFYNHLKLVLQSGQIMRNSHVFKVFIVYYPLGIEIMVSRLWHAQNCYIKSALNVSLIKVSTQLHWGMKYWVDHGTGHANLLWWCDISSQCGRWLGWSGSMSGMMSSHTPAEDSQESGYAPWLSWKCCDLGPGGAARRGCHHHCSGAAHLHDKCWVLLPPWWRWRCQRNFTNSGEDPYKRFHK